MKVEFAINEDSPSYYFKQKYFNLHVFHAEKHIMHILLDRPFHLPSKTIWSDRWKRNCGLAVPLLVS
jgi:hypothetical protein